MAADSQYGDSAPQSNLNKDGTWRSLADVAAKIFLDAAKAREGRK